MKGVAFWFFLSGVIYVTIGMAWGIHMSIGQDFAMAPAHAHLNLLGWVTMALFGLYYNAMPRAAASGLAKIHFLVATLGVWVMIPGIAMAISRHVETGAAIGSLLTIASMLIFLVTVARNRG